MVQLILMAAREVDMATVPFCAHGHTASGAAGVGRQDLRFRLGLRVAEDAAIVVAEDAHDVRSVEVEHHHLAIGIDDFNGCRLICRTSAMSCEPAVCVVVGNGRGLASSAALPTGVSGNAKGR